MNIVYKIAVIGRDDSRSQAKRTFRAFTMLGHNAKFFPFEKWGEATKESFDFAFYVDNADYHIYQKLDCPTFYWASDTGVEGGFRCLTQGQMCDFVFYSQARDSALYPNGEWLPHAHDITYDKPLNFFENRKYDISIIGNFDTRKDRIRIRELVESNFRKSHNIFIKNDVAFEDIFDIYNNTKIVLNHNTYLERLKLKDLNQRTFESCGAASVCLMHKDSYDLEKAGFIPNENCVLFDTDEDAIEQCRWLLQNINIAENIGFNGRNLIRHKHTYVHRAMQIIQKFEKDYIKK